MAKTDSDREFLPVNIAIATISDTRTLENDKSGNLLEKMITESGHTIVDHRIVKDDKPTIIEMLKGWIVDKKVDAIITTGGTGVTGRDTTPEAFREVIEKEIEGFGELFRWLSYSKIGTSTIQSRALGGLAHGTYLFALPGSPGACKDGWKDILEAQFDARHRPCNLVELMPRLLEHLPG